MTLFKVETLMYCCKYWRNKGQLIAGVPYVTDCATGRHGLTDHFALEAWERMTTAGAQCSYLEPEVANRVRHGLPFSTGGRILYHNGRLGITFNAAH